jgi:hypothetical protein
MHMSNAAVGIGGGEEGGKRGGNGRILHGLVLQGIPCK